MRSAAAEPARLAGSRSRRNRHRGGSTRGRSARWAGPGWWWRRRRGSTRALRGGREALVELLYGRLNFEVRSSNEEFRILFFIRHSTLEIRTSSDNPVKCGPMSDDLSIQGTLAETT